MSQIWKFIWMLNAGLKALHETLLELDPDNQRHVTAANRALNWCSTRSLLQPLRQEREVLSFSLVLPDETRFFPGLRDKNKNFWEWNADIFQKKGCSFLNFFIKMICIFSQEIWMAISFFGIITRISFHWSFILRRVRELWIISQVQASKN